MPAYDDTGALSANRQSDAAGQASADSQDLVGGKGTNTHQTSTAFTMDGCCGSGRFCTRTDVVANSETERIPAIEPDES